MAEEVKHVAHETKSDDKETLRIKKVTLWQGLAAILGTLLVISIFTGGFGFGGKSGTDNAPTTVAPTQAGAAKLEIGDAPVKGDNEAPVTIIEFSDPSCPFCAAAAGKNQDVIDYLKGRDPSWEAPLPEIFKEYADAGKVKIAFKYFPGHGTGEGAMKLAWCANEQSKFWEVMDVFFANQDSIENVDKLEDLAAGAGVDKAKLKQCYESGKYDSRLASDTNEGVQAGVGGTPAFFINGKLVSGAQPFSVFKQAIDAELKG